VVAPVILVGVARDWSARVAHTEHHPRGVLAGLHAGLGDVSIFAASTEWFRARDRAAGPDAGLQVKESIG
jgi:hypothetical protein